ncbi:hypothetical protein AAG570_001018 [Ranatra chinensis]|uniref:Uncharacterized protein n=1 Tax=Ranatra chinensis TaxID=642074 RepID=A0ABD0YBE2_9HEMI
MVRRNRDGTPKREIQRSKKALAIVSTEVSRIGSASGEKNPIGAMSRQSLGVHVGQNTSPTKWIPGTKVNYDSDGTSMLIRVPLLPTVPFLVGMTQKERETGVWPSDSNITVLRLRSRRKTEDETREWKDLEDVSLLGDGKHLGESPSLVNLVALVEKQDGDKEMAMLPISSWEPGHPSSSSSEVSFEPGISGNRKRTHTRVIFLEPRRTINRSSSEPVIYKELEEPPNLDSERNSKFFDYGILSMDSEEADSENRQKTLDGIESEQRITAMKYVFKSCFPFLFKRKHNSK